jgi:UDPglucose 6-dehydrogenase
MSDRKHISIFGAGYVGMSLAVLLAERNIVNVFDIEKKRVELINNGLSTVKDLMIQEFLDKKNFKLKATNIPADAIYHSDYYVIATSTDYNPETEYFDTSSVEACIKMIIDSGLNGTIIIKSTIPIGFTERMRKQFNFEKIIFSPEFLREGSALEDNLYPSRIIMGGKCEFSEIFANLLAQSAKKENIPILLMNSQSAESTKLFSNAYLAMRVAFFNELDTFAISNNIEARNVIDGVCLDERIGNYYNNPSFGYGGYCLPKDTKQLLSSFNDAPQNLISAVIDSNRTRKEFIANEILKLKLKIVGIYRLNMKFGSSNFRVSAIIDIINFLKINNQTVIVYEPSIENTTFMNLQVERSLKQFKKSSSIILANRITNELEDVEEKVFSRDLFQEN